MFSTLLSKATCVEYENLGQEFGKHHDQVFSELGAVVQQNSLFPGTYHLQGQKQSEQGEFHQTSVANRGRTVPRTFLAPLRPASTGPSDAWRTDAKSTSTRTACSASVRPATQASKSFHQQQPENLKTYAFKKNIYLASLQKVLAARWT